MTYLIKTNSKFMTFDIHGTFTLTAYFSKATSFKTLAEAKARVETFTAKLASDAESFTQYIAEHEQKLAKATKALAAHKSKLAELMAKPMSEVESQVRKQRTAAENAEYAVASAKRNLDFCKRELRAKTMAREMTIMEVTLKAVA
jgi:flagellar hook-associated protein FlgK